MLRNFLFPSWPADTKSSVWLLAARIIFGALLMSHGIQKCMQFDMLSTVFPDPLGIGSQTSLMLAVFAELLCSAAFIAGFLYRLAMLPMIFTMGVAFFAVHANDPFAVRELALNYLCVFVLLYIAGPGRFAVDRLFVEKRP